MPYTKSRSFDVECFPAFRFFIRVHPRLKTSKGSELEICPSLSGGELSSWGAWKWLANPCQGQKITNNGKRGSWAGNKPGRMPCCAKNQKLIQPLLNPTCDPQKWPGKNWINDLKTICILKRSSALKLLIGLVAAFVLTVPSSKGADWRSIDLSGSFCDAKEDATDTVLDADPDGHPLFRGYARGSGLTSYSLSSGELVDDNSGDLILLVGFTVPKATAANFSLAGARIVDLGPLMPPPANIKLPKKGWFSHPYTGPRKMVIGNYYYVAQSGQHLIIQPVAFKVSNVQINDTMPGAFGYTIHSADGALKARLLSASTLAGLRQLVKDLPSPKPSP